LKFVFHVGSSINPWRTDAGQAPDQCRTNAGHTTRYASSANLSRQA
jgi:hypothetical protein